MSDQKIHLLHSPEDHHFYLEVPFELKDRVKSIGGNWSQSRKAWKFPVDLQIWEQIKSTFGGKGDLLVARSFLSKIESLKKEQEEFFKIRALAEEDSPIDFSVPGISLNGKNPLFNYQKYGIKCGTMVGDGFLIGDQPGLGKSIQAIGIALERKRLGQISNCLIVCLASLKYNWLDEIAKFTNEKALVVDGSPSDRHMKWMASGYFFKIANYETIVGDLYVDSNPRHKNKKILSREDSEFRKYMQSQFDMVVVDEIHAIKHHSSRRTEAVKQLKPIYRVGLSGTPIDGRLEELHSIFGFLKPGLFESRSKFMDNHAIKDHFGQVTGYYGVQEVRDKINPYYIRRLKEKVLKDLPPKLYKDIYVDLPEKEMKIYKDLISGASEITEEDAALTRLIRVRQFLNFPEIIRMRNSSYKFLSLAALLEELVDENHDKVIIFTQFHETLDLLVKNLRSKYNILQIHGGVPANERTEIVKRFNSDPEEQILIGTDAMSTGLNIGGANDVIMYEDNFSPAIMQQREDRAHRATTRHNVTIYRFICRGTIEEKVRKALGNKMSLNNQVLDEDCKTFGVDNLSSLDLLQYL